MCTQFGYDFNQMVFILMGLSAILFLFRATLIWRLKQVDIGAYEELGCPSFSDLFGTKAGRALLQFLWKRQFRTYEDKLLVSSAWLTIVMFLLCEIGLAGGLAVVALCH